MKKLMGIIAILIIAMAFIAGFWILHQIKQREALRDAQISIEKVDLRPTSNGEIFDVTFKIYNPDNIIATLDNMVFYLYGNNNYLGNGTINQGIDIPPGESRNATAEFNILSGSSVGTIMSIIELRKLDLKIIGHVHVNIASLKTIDVPFQFDIVKND